MVVMPLKETKEVDVGAVINSWHKRLTGKGCGQIRAKMLGNMLVIEMSGILNKYDEALVSTQDGAQSVRRLREMVVLNNRAKLEGLISQHMERDYHLLVYKIDQDFGRASLIMVSN